MDRGPSGGAVWHPGQLIAPEPAAQKAWMDAQKDAKALQALASHFDAAEVDDDQAPLRRCHRYLIGPRNQLNYREALANDLPIGSGEIESAHRYIAELRLKRPGAGWRVQHAEHTLALRINRRNGDWKTYWATLGRSSSPASNQNRPPLSRKVAA
jgi:hypothetical protein